MYALKRTAVLATLFVVLTVKTNGQDLQGVVRSDSKEPLERVYVLWKNETNTIVFTDSSGKFTIPKSSTQDTLFVTMIGFEPAEKVIRADQTYVEFVLKSSAVLQGVQIGEARLPKSLDIRSVRQITRFSEREFTKAACCNLSESFENISAVDVATSDAVTGMRQIQMMGFSGIYIQTQIDNLPFATGLLAASGLTYIPGMYVKGMQLSKGVGSVTNGYDGMTGSLNIELRKPIHKERLILNGYFNPMNLRAEGNVIYTQQVSNTWATTTMLHGSGVYAKADMNHDGIQDFPLQNNLNISNSWMFMKGKWEGSFGAKYLNYKQELGVNNPEKTGNQEWKSRHSDELVEVRGMLGYLFSEHHSERSMGLRFNAVRYKLGNTFGNRNYLGDEKSVRVNWLYQGIAGNSFHKFTTGVSFYGNQTDEIFTDDFHNLDLFRKEWVPGVFLEWTESSIKNLTLVGGIRFDYHNFFGSIVTPRLHGKYSFNEHTELRFGGGRGQRTANPFADYQGLFSSNRRVYLPQNVNDGFYGLQQEVSWNTGASLSRTFKILHRPATLVADYYYTWFDNQLQVDRDYNASELRFYNIAALGLRSFSHSASVELDFSPVRRSEIRMAYRYIDSRSGFMDGVTRFNPLISPHRAFFNAAYETRTGWAFDFTVNWQSSKRLPQGENLSPALQNLPKQSPSYTNVISQVTKKFNKQFEAYIGGENLLNIMQHDLIRMASDPSSPFFDPTLIWGPSLGAMFYVGFRYYVY